MLQAMFGRATDLTPAMQRIGAYQISSIHMNFLAGGRPQPWAPLRAGTVTSWIGRYKAGGAYRQRSAAARPRSAAELGLNVKGKRAVAGRRPLMDTGTLDRSVRVHRAWTRGLEMASGGGAVPYAAVHQFGANIPPIYPRRKKALWWPGLPRPVKHTHGAKIPARPFMLWQTEDLVRAQNILRDHVMGG